MRRMTHRVVLLAAVGGMALAATPAHAASAVEASEQCVVEQVDERGGVTHTSAAREGSVYGQFRCVGGQWELETSPFERGDAITSGAIQVDPSGNVSASRLSGPALSYGMSLAEMARVYQAVTGEAVTIERAVVTVDDGRIRTPEQIEALLAGRDTTGARVLDIVDRPDQALSPGDIVGDAGGTPGNTVVYLSIWGAIKNAFWSVVDAVTDAYDWLDEHCDWHFVPPPNFGIELRCRFTI